MRLVKNKFTNEQTLAKGGNKLEAAYTKSLFCIKGVLYTVFKACFLFTFLDCSGT